MYNIIDVIMQFLGFEHIVDVMEYFPEQAEVVVLRVFETGCVCYILMLGGVTYMICSMFRAFFKRA